MTSIASYAKLLLALIAAMMVAGAGSGQPVADINAASRAAWGFDRSDLTPHPAVRFGVLGNGMRYAVMANAAPSGSLSVRLRIDAGSSVEGERERGFMHLVEHLIFHGSANLPKGALLLMLPQQGLASWSDFNAFTSFDETVYQLDLRRADPRARATALMLMREISSNLRFGRQAVEGAKKMVMEEIASRDAVQDRIATAQNAFFVPGTPIARGPVAGTEASVSRARGGVLERLYARTYVPRRATLVIVGDLDPVAVEAEIAARFADWEARAPDGAESPRPVIDKDRGTEARLFVDPAAPSAVTIASVAPIGAGDAGAPRDSRFLAHLGAEMLSRRLAGIAARSDAPYRSASVAIYDHFSTASFAQIDVAARGRDWRGALQRSAAELNRALGHGFSTSELDAQLAASQRGLTAAAGPRATRALADAIVEAVGRKIVFTAPADRAASEAYLSRVRLSDVNVAFRSAWAGRSRLIFVSHDQQVPDGEATVAAAWAASTAPAGGAPTSTDR